MLGKRDEKKKTMFSRWLWGRGHVSGGNLCLLDKTRTKRGCNFSGREFNPACRPAEKNESTRKWKQTFLRMNGGINETLPPTEGIDVASGRVKTPGRTRKPGNS